MKKKFLFAAFLICGAISSVAEEKPKYKDASLPRGTGRGLATPDDPS